MTAPTAAARVRLVPGPVRFLGRALGTLWSNGKARIGLVILG